MITPSSFWRSENNQQNQTLRRLTYGRLVKIAENKETPYRRPKFLAKLKMCVTKSAPEIFAQVKTLQTVCIRIPQTFRFEAEPEKFIASKIQKE